MVVSVHLDERERRLLERLAKRMRKSRSDVIRAAIAVLAQREHVEETRSSAYRRVAHLIGCVRGGGADFSERTGLRFREALGKSARG